jgi:hypothetical protein
MPSFFLVEIPLARISLQYVCLMDFASAADTLHNRESLGIACIADLMGRWYKGRHRNPGQDVA